MKYIYKITYPNGKIYIGKDLIGEISYMGSVDPKLVAKDFSKEEWRHFIVIKDILWESDTASDEEVNQKEVEYIKKYNSNDPNIGYNRWPRYRA